MRVDRFDTLEDLNKGLAALQANGRKIIGDIKIFSYTSVKEDGFPVQIPLFFVTHEKGVIVR